MPYVTALEVIITVINFFLLLFIFSSYTNKVRLSRVLA